MIEMRKKKPTLQQPATEPAAEAAAAVTTETAETETDAGKEETPLETPLWQDPNAPILRNMLEMRALAEEVARAQIEEPPPPELTLDMPTQVQDILQHLIKHKVLSISEIASLANCSLVEAYEIAMYLVDNNLARSEKQDNERYIIATINSVDEAKSQKWVCAVCRARFSPSELIAAVCPRCGSSAFWYP